MLLIVSNIEKINPSEFQLSQNYPNPFRKKTKIKYCVPEMSKVEITLFNSSGEMIERLVNQQHEPGVYEVKFDAFNIGGSRIKSGAYYYQMKANDYISTKTMLYTRNFFTSFLRIFDRKKFNSE